MGVCSMYVYTYIYIPFSELFKTNLQHDSPLFLNTSVRIF